MTEPGGRGDPRAGAEPSAPCGEPWPSPEAAAGPLLAALRRAGGAGGAALAAAAAQEQRGRAGPGPEGERTDGRKDGQTGRRTGGRAGGAVSRGWGCWRGLGHAKGPGARPGCLHPPGPAVGLWGGGGQRCSRGYRFVSSLPTSCFSVFLLKIPASSHLRLPTPGVGRCCLRSEGESEASGGRPGGSRGKGKEPGL